MPFKTIYKKAFNFALRKGKQPADCEDFAQFCCLYAFRKNRPDPYYRTLWVDFVRKAAGDNRKKHHVKVETQVIDETEHVSPNKTDQDLEARSVNKHALRQLEPYQRMLYRLRFKHELPLQLLAELMGVEVSAVSYYLREIGKKLRR